jgi:hypothetical protein
MRSSFFSHGKHSGGKSKQIGSLALMLHMIRRVYDMLRNGVIEDVSTKHLLIMSCINHCTGEGVGFGYFEESIYGDDGGTPAGQHASVGI